jgi:predicted enzyme related to lactoylglutathione lyase
MSAADLSAATVGQLLIPVSNLDAATEFYRDKLGLKFLFAAPPQMTFYQAGEARLLVGVPENPGAKAATIYFRVAGIEAVYRTLVSRGVSIPAAPHLVHRAPDYELWLAEFRDPDGNGLALMEEKKS